MASYKYRITGMLFPVLIFSISLAARTGSSCYLDPDSVITSMIADNHFAGVAACITSNGNLLWSKGYGMADTEQQRTVTPNSLFHQGSVSKTVTAAALLQLLEKHGISIDDPVNDYLDFKISNPWYEEVPVTFRILLTHTASITDRSDSGNNLAFLYTNHDQADSLGIVLKEILTRDGSLYSEKYFLKEKPGAKYEYSNLGYSLIGYLVEKISGEPFYEYVRRNIFGPLEMPGSTYLLSETDKSLFAYQYRYNPEGTGTTTKIRPFTWPGYPDGSLRTSVTEYSHFLTMLMNGGKYNSKEILKKETVDEMMTLQHLPGLPAGNLAPLIDLALGWSVIDMNGRTIYSYNGFGDGFFSVVFFDPKINRGGCIFISGTLITSRKTADQLRQVIWAMLTMPAGETEPGNAGVSAGLNEHLRFLASDARQGRGTGSQGLKESFDYAEKIFICNGLQPVFSSHQSDDPYRQEIEITERFFNPPDSFIIDYKKQQRPFSLEEMKYIFSGDQKIFSKKLPVEYLDYAIYEPQLTNIHMSDLDLRGKIAVIKAGAPDGILPDSIFIRNNSPEGTFERVINIAGLEKRPEGIIVLADDEIAKQWPDLPDACKSPHYIPGITLPNRLTLFPGDLIFLKGEASGYLENKLSRITEIKKVKSKSYIIKPEIECNIQYTDHPLISCNLGGYLPGIDSLLSDEYVVVGAHLDHLGVIDGEIYNGADDNASGCAAILELVRLLVGTDMKRSVVFLLWTGEEMEAMGSQQFFEQLPFPEEKISCYINFDMIGRTAPENEQTKAIYISTDEKYIDSTKQLLEIPVFSSVMIPLVFTTSGLSDHSVFAANDIFTFGFYSGHHPDVHKPTDDIEKINVDQMCSVVLLADKLIQYLANN